MLNFDLWFLQARQVQLDLLQAAAFVKGNSESKKIEAGIARQAALYAAEISPFWTGALSSSHMIEDVGEMHHVFLNPSVRNPITGDPPATYGVEQHAIGGRKAFYDRTVEEIGQELLDQAGEKYTTRLEAYF